MAQIDRDTARTRCRQPRASSAVEEVDSVAGWECWGSEQWDPAIGIGLFIPLNLENGSIMIYLEYRRVLYVRIDSL